MGIDIESYSCLVNLQSHAIPHPLHTQVLPDPLQPIIHKLVHQAPWQVLHTTHTKEGVKKLVNMSCNSKILDSLILINDCKLWSILVLCEFVVCNSLSLKILMTLFILIINLLFNYIHPLFSVS